MCQINALSISLNQIGSRAQAQFMMLDHMYYAACSSSASWESRLCHHVQVQIPTHKQDLPIFAFATQIPGAARQKGKEKGKAEPQCGKRAECSMSDKSTAGFALVIGLTR